MLPGATLPFQNFTKPPQPMNVSNMRRGSGSGRRVVSQVSSGGWSGSQYDVMSYQEAARQGQIQVRLMVIMVT